MIGGSKFMVFAGETSWTRLLHGGNYLAVFLVGVPLGILANDLYPGIPVFKGQAWVVLAPWVCAFVSGALWLRFRSDTKRSPILTAFLLSFAAMWLALWLLEHADGRSQNYTTFLVPILLALLFLKPVSLCEVRVAAAALAWMTVSIVVVAEIHAALTGYRGAPWGWVLRIRGVSEDDMSGIRWQGPFGNPNYAGPVGAYLIIYALSQRGRTRSIIGVAGAGILLMAGSRSAILGAAVGVAVYFVYSTYPRLARLTRRMRVLLVLGFVIATASVGVLLDPTMNGRTLIWPDYWDLWMSSLVTGAGTTTINQRIRDGSLLPWSVHAHDLFLDLLGRYGLLGFAAGSALCGLAMVITIRGARAAAPLGLAVLLSFLTIGLVEVHGSWLYWALPSGWILIATLWAHRASVRSDYPEGNGDADSPTRAKCTGVGPH